MAARDIGDQLPKLVVICIVGEYISEGGLRRWDIRGVVMGKLVASVLATLLFGLLEFLFGLLECPISQEMRGVIRLVAMRFLAVAVTCCREREGFNTVRARVSTFAVGTSRGKSGIGKTKKNKI